jgi:hypothetical protein
MTVNKVVNAPVKRKTPMTKIKTQPDPKLHQQISFVKSLLRIIAGGAMIATNLSIYLAVAGVLIIGAEILGIAEELV